MYKKFEQLLEKQNLTAYAVAKSTGVSPVTLSDWKHGKSNSKVDKLKKIADYFGVSIDYFLD